MLRGLIHPPACPPLDLPVAARALPRVKASIERVVQGMYLLGYADGLTMGVVLGLVAAILGWALLSAALALLKAAIRSALLLLRDSIDASIPPRATSPDPRR